MIKRNPFVFGLNQAKIKDAARKHNGEMRLSHGFDLFNRRTEFPYDLVDNPMRIDPVEIE